MWLLEPEPPAPPTGPLLCGLLRAFGSPLVLRPFRRVTWRYYGRYALQGGGEEVILALKLAAQKLDLLLEGI